MDKRTALKILEKFLRCREEPCALVPHCEGCINNQSGLLVDDALREIISTLDESIEEAHIGES